MHEIFGERFLNSREKAWHGLGLTVKEPMGAVDALRLMGEYSIRMEPLYMANGTKVERQAIVREATAKGEAESVLGTVGPEYQPIGPLATCALYDDAVNQPVETIGALRDGAVLFITVKMPDYAVAGDEISDYLLVMNPMDGLEAAQIITSPVRVVCMNTLRMARSLGAVQYRIRHNAGAHIQMRDWLKTVYTKAAGKSAAIKDACEILASYRVTDTEVAETLLKVYPDPKQPRNTAPGEVMKKRLEHREYIGTLQSVARQETGKLFYGAGKGMDTVAAAGTAWGLYNAVVEYQDYRWARNERQAQESALFGPRADVKEWGFEKCAELAGLKV